MPSPAGAPPPAPGHADSGSPLGPLPAGRRDLLLYLLVGFGLFITGSLYIGRLAGRIDLAISMALYALNVISFAGTAVVLGILRPRLSLAQFGLRPFPLRWLWIALGAAVVIMPLRAAAALLAQWLLARGLQDMQARLDLVVPQDGPLMLNLLVTLLGAGLLAPLAEEFYFRGLLHRWFWLRWAGRPWARVVASSAIFALGHFDSPGVAASSFFLGVICAVAYERSRSLWLPVAIHVGNNSLAVVLVYAALALAPSMGS
jgi:uncharacterized protein